MTATVCNHQEFSFSTEELRSALPTLSKEFVDSIAHNQLDVLAEKASRLCRSVISRLKAPLTRLRLARLSGKQNPVRHSIIHRTARAFRRHSSSSTASGQSEPGDSDPSSHRIPLLFLSLDFLVSAIAFANHLTYGVAK